MYAEDIIRLMTDDDPAIRRMALSRFDDIPLGRRLIKMISFLDHSDSMSRFFAESYLLGQGSEGIPFIAHQLASRIAPATKSKLIHLLAKIPDLNVGDVIAAQLQSDNEIVVTAAISALSKRNARQHQAAIRHCFERGICKRECLRFLANYAAIENTVLFKRTLDDPDILLQLEAARALARARDFSALSRLIFKLTDPNGPHKTEILMAISDIIAGNPQENFVLPPQLRGILCRFA